MSIIIISQKDKLKVEMLELGAAYFVPLTKLSALQVSASFTLHNNSVICTHFSDKKHEA